MEGHHMHALPDTVSGLSMADVHSLPTGACSCLDTLLPHLVHAIHV